MKQNRTKTPEWDNVSKDVLTRDSDHCQKCGNHDGLHIHHIKPVYLGGEDDPENLITLCFVCHEEWHAVESSGVASFKDWIQLPSIPILISILLDAQMWRAELSAPEMREIILSARQSVFAVYEYKYKQQIYSSQIPYRRPISFRSWLIRQKDRRDPIGDLALDVKDDRSFPKTSKQLSTYERYLFKHNACSGTKNALLDAWKEWEEYLSVN